jgi:BioD-like phosphotransacetylase family protein
MSVLRTLPPALVFTTLAAAQRMVPRTLEFLFQTDQSDHVMREILRFLATP